MVESSIIYFDSLPSSISIRMNFPNETIWKNLYPHMDYLKQSFHMNFIHSFHHSYHEKNHIVYNVSIPKYSQNKLDYLRYIHRCIREIQFLIGTSCTYSVQY